MLGRTFHLLFKRARSRNAQLIERIKHEEHEHNEKVRAVQEQVKSRQAVLDALGHEIKSPLQTLLIKMPENSKYRPEIERMRRAVDALYDATSAEAGLQSGTIIAKKSDLSAYLKKLVTNLRNEQHKDILFKEISTPVFAIFDPIAFNTVLEHILDNAYRHKTPGSSVEISLYNLENGVTIEIYNKGDWIPTEQLEAIFNFGVSAHANPENRGIGLFSSRSIIVGMRGTIEAENRPQGVAFIITLPS